MSDLKSIQLPQMAFIKQELNTSKLKKVSDAVFSALSHINLPKETKPGDSVAVVVGSRGIDRIDRVTYHTLTFLKERGFRPFIVPGMGSHGGGTEKGQTDVLAKLGIAKTTMDVPISSEMEVSCIDRLPNGTSIYIAKSALSADRIVVINRIKPHTKFSGDIESGLCKMLTIGLGKVKGATEFHRSAVSHSFRIIEDAARIAIDRLPVLFGLGLLEDGYGQLSRVESLLPSVLVEREKALLKDATSMMGRIPFDPIDILIVDYFGKDISGIGMDSNVTGRHRDLVGDFCTAPHVKRIFVRELSPVSDGNGNGIGLADVTTKRLVDALNLEKTYVNAIAAISMEKAAIPMYFATDYQALEACIQTSGLDSAEDARMVRIKDTASLGCIQISKALENDLMEDNALERLTPWSSLDFDENHNIRSFPSIQ